ncbi:NlpC/P60 family protein [Limibacterium fermenti]|uniref:C40 family peptidase n=1 Tax=Limibacterium fermenti TaxID=3229863 RepID=UPI000E8C049A|nr:glycoside hydrolase [Porphyromonadaceae bacterium]
MKTKQKIGLLSFMWTVSFLFSMAQNSQQIQEIRRSVQQQYAPDKRTEVFDIRVEENAQSLVLKGETSSHEAYRTLIQRLQALPYSLQDSIRLLPDVRLQDKTWGVIYNSVGTLHSAPSYSSETVSQVLLGMPVKILDEQGGWRRIQTPEKYIGWINRSVQPMTESELDSYRRQPKIVITRLYTSSYEKANARSQQVSDLVTGNTLAVTGTKGKYYRVVYPDGRKAFVPKADAENEQDWFSHIQQTPEAVTHTALKFMGIPYVWGGTSAKGLDCSGFTKTVYLHHGILLARDASQQVLYGKLIDDTADFTEAQPGDLVFFGTPASNDQPRERVVHVGIYLGDKKFIHASDHIRISSFDPADPLYDAYNSGRYLRTKRILGEVGTPGIEEIRGNDFYRPAP